MDQFLGQICLFGFPFAPQNWALCNGQMMSIAQNSALFSLLGTTYGGDGVSTFALPNLQGRVPVCQGQGQGLTPRVMGELSGNENVTLTADQMPMHNHMLTGLSSGATAGSPASNMLASSNGALDDGTPVSVNTYGPSSDATTTLDPKSISIAGNSQPVPVMQPYLVMNYCIALTGIFPPRS